MRGVVLNPWGAQASNVNTLSGYNGAEIMTATAGEWGFWRWRVNAIQVVSTLTLDGNPFIQGTTTSQKVNLLDEIHDNEIDLVNKFAEYDHLVSSGGSSFVVGLMNAFFRYDNGLWQNSFIPRAIGPALERLEPYNPLGVASAATATLAGSDPVTGLSFSRTLDLVEVDGTWGGSLTITPASFYDWSGLYDTATGARLQNPA